MKNPQDSAKCFSTLLKKLKKRAAQPPGENGDAITVLVRSFLMWDATTTKAQTAGAAWCRPCMVRSASSAGRTETHTTACESASSRFTFVTEIIPRTRGSFKPRSSTDCTALRINEATWSGRCDIGEG